MLNIGIQFFGGRGSGGGARSGGGTSPLSGINNSSSMQERTGAINRALSSGTRGQALVDAANGYPKGTIVTTYGFGGAGGSYEKTGGVGRSGWRNISTYERESTASIFLYSNIREVSASRRRR